MQIKVDVLGDISLAYTDSEENHYVSLAKKINNILGAVDYRIANLESPLCLKDSIPIKKMGPNLRMKEKHIPFFENVLIDCYTLANNHLGDFGQAGVIDTINVLQDLNKDYVGSSTKYEETYKPLRKVIKDLKLSFISVCENEFGVARNGELGAAGYDGEKIKQALDTERGWADFSIIVFHGGTEYYPYPTPGVRNRYRGLVELGANAVIGMHTHCPQGYEIYHGAPIIYSVGNFFFPKDCSTLYETWQIGYVCRLKLEKDQKAQVEIVPYWFDIYGCDFLPICPDEFSPYLGKLSEIIQDDSRLRELYKNWAIIKGKAYLDLMGKELTSMSDEEKSHCVTKNIFSCESHNELITTYSNCIYYGEDSHDLSIFFEIKEDMKYTKFRMADDMSYKPTNIDTVLWGVGKKAEMLFYHLEAMGKQIVFVDKNIMKQGFSFLGRKIISPEEAVEQFKDADFYICTSPESEVEIAAILKENNCKRRELKCM